jgi:hypothetical protein
MILGGAFGVLAAVMYGSLFSEGTNHGTAIGMGLALGTALGAVVDWFRHRAQR